MALVLALGGGAAIASHEAITSSDIVDDAVRSRHIANRQVGASELASGTVIASKLAPGSVGSAAVAAGGVGAADLAADAVAGADIADASQHGGKVLDGSLTPLDVAEASFDRTRFHDSQSGDCDPQNESFVSCAQTTVQAPVAGTVLLIATATWETNAFGAKGTCKLENPANIQLDVWNAGENANTTDVEGDHLNHAAILEAHNVPSGPTTFELLCNETESDIVYHDVHLTAINSFGAGS